MVEPNGADKADYCKHVNTSCSLDYILREYENKEKKQKEEDEEDNEKKKQEEDEEEEKLDNLKHLEET